MEHIPNNLKHFEDTLNNYIVSTGKSDVEYDATVVSINPDGRLPILEDAIITLPNGSKSMVRVVSQNTKTPMKYQFKHPDFYLKLHAYDDAMEWSKRVIEDASRLIPELKGLTGEFSSQTAVSPNVDRNIELLFSDTHHWYAAIRSKGFSRNVRRLVNLNVDKELEKSIKHLRNIKEHWNQNQVYFFGKPVPSNRDMQSVRWYLDYHPESDPWTIYKPHGITEPLVAGAIKVSLIHKEVDKISRIITDNVAERVLFDTLRART